MTFVLIVASLLIVGIAMISQMARPIGVNEERIPDDRNIHTGDLEGSVPIPIQASDITDGSTGTPSVVPALVPIGDTTGVNGGPAINNNFATIVRLLNSINGRTPDWTVAGTNATSALVTAGARGGRVLTTAGAAADQILLSPRAGTRFAVGYNTSRAPRASFLVETPADLTNLIFKLPLALTSAPDTATDANQAAWFFNAGVDLIPRTAVSIAGVDDVRVVNEFGALSPSTLYEFVIEVGPDRIPRFYMRQMVAANVLSGDFVASGRTNVATGAIQPYNPMTAAIVLFPFPGIQAGAAAAATSLTIFKVTCAHGLR